MSAATEHDFGIDELREQLDGDLITAGEASYDEARQVFLKGIDNRPLAVAQVADADDVAAVVDAARDGGLELAVRSGGHSRAGYGTVNGGLVIDLSRMNGVEIDIDDGTAWVQTGATAGQYTLATAEHGRTTGLGDTGSVGVGGITLAGGIGYLVRKSGLTIDNLLAAEVVVADGEVVLTNEDSEPELFWAIRGGESNFGVATRFQLRLAEVSEIVGGMLILPATPEVITGFLAAAQEAPEELSAIANVMIAPPMPFLPEAVHGTPVLMGQFAYAGEIDQAERVIAPFRALAEPVADMVRPMRYPELYDGPAAQVNFMAGSNFFADSLDLAAAEVILEQLPKSTAPMRAVQLRVLGGAYARVPNDATAFAHRDRALFVNVAAMYMDAGETDDHDAWTSATADAMGRDGAGGYVGFLGAEDEATVRGAYPGATWDRLREVKRRYDPTNLFHLNHNIPPAAGDSRSTAGEHDRARGGDRRGRSDRADVGGRAGAGGRRRRHRRAARQPGLAGSRAGGLHSRTIEVLDQRGIADRFLAEGQKVQVAAVRRGPLDISDFPTRHNYGLGLWQNDIERILAGWVDELGGADLSRTRGDRLRAGRHRRRRRAVRRPVAAGAVPRRVRRRAQPDPQGSRHRFPRVGSDDQRPDRRGRAGRGAGMGHPPRRPRHPRARQGGVRDPRRRGGLRGQRAGASHGHRRACRVRRPSRPCAISARRSSPSTGPTTAFTVPPGSRRFTDMTRQAATYRDGRVLLAGDAAHVHSPDGGQGLNIGVQDAVNLGWKLAQVVNGTSPESLLDTYHAERHPVGARVLRNTMAQVALRRPDERTKALRDTVAELLGMDEPRERFAAMMSGLDIHYDLGEGHPLLGRRMPDLDLVTADGPLRVFTPAARGPAGAAQPRRARRPRHRAVGGSGSGDRRHYDGAWELRHSGRSPPAAVLVRPDGYVAWVGDGTDRGSVTR